ncbi:hypothetical protein oki390_05700 [Helicobacter pylori]
MAEWKTDTEEVKQIVKKCRDFKGSLQEKKCAQFIKNLDGYAREILLERRKIELQLQGVIEELRKAKRNEEGAKYVLRGLQVGSLLSFIFPPVKIAATAAIAAAEMVLKFMKEDTEKCKRNVELLQQALEIYSTQARASRELVDGAWESVKKILEFYTHKHQEFIKRLNYVSEAIDNQYNIAPPEILNEGDFESPTIIYNPKKSVFDERFKGFGGNLTSLHADLKDKIHHNALSDDELDRIIAFRGQEFEKNLEDLMLGFGGGTNALSDEELERMANFREQEFEKNLEDLMPSSLGFILMMKA